MRRKAVAMAVTGLFALGAVCWLGSTDSADAGDRGVTRFRYEVSLTNITRKQIFSPAVIYTHTRRMQPLFTLGQPASEEVAAVAEDALLDPLVARVSASPNVQEVSVITGAEGPILPGETASVVVEASARASRISLIGMLVTTNDAFYALNGSSGPVFGSAEYLLLGYDAGSEANTELCEHIPGPPCGNGGVRVPDGAEGYVHIHSGIHGVGDLLSSEYDWKNPVALLRVRRLGVQE